MGIKSAYAFWSARAPLLTFFGEVLAGVISNGDLNSDPYIRNKGEGMELTTQLMNSIIEVRKSEISLWEISQHSHQNRKRHKVKEIRQIKKNVNKFNFKKFKIYGLEYEKRI